MIPVKTQQKYKCDFCKYRSVKHRVEIHEKRCYRNPNRFCDFCKNDGYTMEWVDEVGDVKVDCPYCAKFDKEVLEQIKRREDKQCAEVTSVDPSKIPF